MFLFARNRQSVAFASGRRGKAGRLTYIHFLHVLHQTSSINIREHYQSGTFDAQYLGGDKYVKFKEGRTGPEDRAKYYAAIYEV
jgi:hypothetical protein